jgi:hypothetical protein
MTVLAGVALAAAPAIALGQSNPAAAGPPAVAAGSSAGNRSTAIARQAEAGERRFQLDLYWENDGTILKPNNTQDRHYTNGNAITFAHHPQWADDLADWAEPIALDAGFDRADAAGGYVFGHQMYTPQDITARQLIEDDRPYAGYLYGGVYWQRANEHTFDHVELNLGLVGPSALGKEAQNVIHNVTEDRDPRGWGNQLSDEPTGQLFIRRRHRLPVHALWTDAEAPLLGVELLPKAELALGTVHRYVAGGVMLRAGWKLPDDFGPGEIHELASATRTRPGRAGWGVYWFGGASGRVVEHNLFLEGNTFTDSHSVEPEPLVGRLRTGVAVQYTGDAWRLEGAWSQSFLTEEFEQQDAGHAFGQLRLSITRRF